MKKCYVSPVRDAVLLCLATSALAFGPSAGAVCADENTCFGTGVLDANTTGRYNAGFGYLALQFNTEGHYNTAVGFQALTANTTGLENTASGALALTSNTSGGLNTAVGFGALYSNTTGGDNTASGYAALSGNTTGHSNTASGFLALSSNTSGFYNTTHGAESLASNTQGRNNTATGGLALSANLVGNANTADGYAALRDATGHRNVAMGSGAGSAITTGSDNIIIGAVTPGRADDDGVIRIGVSGRQQRAFIAGVRGARTGSANAVPVMVDSKGQLGTISSSRRFKDDVQAMGGASERLYALRPVTFRYKQPYEDGSRPVQFGLVAEEVADAFPELVVYAEDGTPETVRYHLLASLLLNELQKEHAVMQDQSARIATLEKQAAAFAELEAKVARMTLALERLGREPQERVAANP